MDKSYSSLMIPQVPALIFEAEKIGRTLVIADLHIGYVYSRNKRGIIIPFKERPEEELFELVKQVKPKQLIILGDFKDDIFGASNALARRIWEFLRRLLELTKVTILKGNHDGRLEEFVSEEVRIVPASGMIVAEAETNKVIGLWHGHASPSLEVITADITISAHAHPAYVFRDSIGSKITEKVWIKTKWLQADQNQGEISEDKKQRIHLIIPAFNKYISGISVDRKDFSDLVLMREAIDFDNAEVFTLEGVLLGTIQELKEARREREQKQKEARKKQLKRRRKRK